MDTCIHVYTYIYIYSHVDVYKYVCGHKQVWYQNTSAVASFSAGLAGMRRDRRSRCLWSGAFGSSNAPAAASAGSIQVSPSVGDLQWRLLEIAPYT